MGTHYSDHKLLAFGSHQQKGPGMESTPRRANYLQDSFVVGLLARPTARGCILRRGCGYVPFTGGAVRWMLSVISITDLTIFVLAI